jgi:hypothetical protein
MKIISSSIFASTFALGIIAASLLPLSAASVSAASTAAPGKDHAKQSYSPYAERRYPARPLFGDTHLHTSQSSACLPGQNGCFVAKLADSAGRTILNYQEHQLLDNK